MKSVEDYKVLLNEVQLAKLAYHTYPLPHTVLVLKGIPPNVPVEEIQADLTSQDPRIVKIVQITKMDKTTHAVITKFPVFVITF
jgi:hypothetical protein